MKIVVIGGTGLIGSKVVQRLRDAGHEAVVAAPSTGVDILTGAGLEDAMAGTDVVVDLANSPSFEAQEHKIGPLIGFETEVAENRTLGLELGVFFGLTDAAPAAAAKAKPAQAEADASASVPPPPHGFDVGAVIAKALRAAGLMMTTPSRL